MIRSITFDAVRAKAIGLEPCSLRDLGNVVILAGPNGSGKSRFLQLIEPTVSTALSAQKSAPRLRERMQRQIAAGAPSAAIGELQQQIDQALGEGRPDVTFDPGPASIVDLGPSVPSQINDPATHSGGDLPQILSVTRTGAFHQLYAAQHVFLRAIAQALFNSEHPRLRQDLDVQASLAEAERFNNLLSSLGLSEVGFDLNEREPRPTLFGRPVVPSEWSAGQRLLITWAICLHEQGVGRLAKSIVLLDEPEGHLHAAACVEVVEKLRGAVGNEGQLWIATHSASLVAHFGTASVHMVRGGRLTYAGSRLDEIIDGLLGGREARHNFRCFLGEAHLSSLARFAVESLTDAAVARFAKDDAQAGLLVASLRRAASDGRRLRVLDYASGRARFARALLERFGKQGAEAVVDYHTFDDRGSDGERNDRAASMAALYGEEDAQSRMHSHLTDFMPPNAVDVVVMCNVLHEIPPRKWRTLFDDIHGVLAGSGFLLLMEDQQISIGEMPHLGGFMVLNLDEIRVLVSSPLVEDAVPSTSARLTAFAIPRGVLQKVTQETLSEAVRRVRFRALGELRSLRLSASSTGAAGRQHAYFALLHANAALALEDFGTE